MGAWLSSCFSCSQQIQSLQKEKEELQKYNKELLKKMEESFKQNQQLKRQIVELKQQSTTSPRNTFSVKQFHPITNQNEVQGYQQQIQRLRWENTNMKEQQKNKRSNINYLNDQLEKNKLKLELITKQIHQLRAQTAASNNTYEAQIIPRYQKYFAGEVLDDDVDFKDFLMNFIEKEFKARIKRTKLLFRHQKNSNRNLHPFTDGKAPFVIVIKTEDGYCLAGISEEALSPQTDGRKRGWLISLTNSQRVFPSIPGKAAIQYDGIYLIFGNQQIRVKGSSDVVFSNFGIGNSYYETRGTVKDFIGPGSNGNPRETPIETFEIFQILFQ